MKTKSSATLISVLFATVTFVSPFLTSHALAQVRQETPPSWYRMSSGTVDGRARMALLASKATALHVVTLLMITTDLDGQMRISPRICLAVGQMIEATMMSAIGFQRHHIDERQQVESRLNMRDAISAGTACGMDPRVDFNEVVSEEVAGLRSFNEISAISTAEELMDAVRAIAER